ncbi:MAG: hypothetical protein ACJ73E_08425 [Mycobacteriales bacterium]
MTSNQRPWTAPGDATEVEACARALLGGGTPRPRLLAAAALWPHKFHVSLLSSWQARGETLDPAQAALVRAAAQRSRRHQALAVELCAAVPGLWRLKGPATGRLYPAGVLRSERDVDLGAPGEGELWDAVRLLAGRGWTVDAVWLRAGRDGRDRQVAATLRSPGPEPDLVEVTTDPLEGDHWRVDSRPLELAGTDSASLAFLLLVEEGTARPYGVRDVYDAVLLLRQLARTGRGGRAAELLAAAGLGRQWARLRRGVLRSGLVGDPYGLVQPTDRRAPAVRSLRRPVRSGLLLAGYLLRRYEWTPAAGLLTRAQAVLGAGRCYRSRIALNGVQVGPPTGPAARSAALRFAGPLGLLVTPVGDFALSIGGDVLAEWLELEAASGP